MESKPIKARLKTAVFALADSTHCARTKCATLVVPPQLGQDIPKTSRKRQGGSPNC